MKTIALASVAIALAVTPAVALAGGQGVAKSCGKIEVTKPLPALGLAKTGTWWLNDFAPTKKQLIPCTEVRKVAAGYIATGAHPGYVVKGFTGLTGRNFYKGKKKGEVGFQIYRPTT